MKIPVAWFYFRKWNEQSAFVQRFIAILSGCCFNHNFENGNGRRGKGVVLLVFSILLSTVVFLEPEQAGGKVTENLLLYFNLISLIVSSLSRQDT